MILTALYSHYQDLQFLKLNIDFGCILVNIYLLDQ